jgi:hypothetical protein
MSYPRRVAQNGGEEKYDIIKFGQVNLKEKRKNLYK